MHTITPFDALYRTIPSLVSAYRPVHVPSSTIKALQRGIVMAFQPQATCPIKQDFLGESRAVFATFPLDRMTHVKRLETQPGIVRVHFMLEIDARFGQAVGIPVNGFARMVCPYGVQAVIAVAIRLAHLFINDVKTVGVIVVGNLLLRPQSRQGVANAVAHHVFAKAFQSKCTARLLQRQSKRQRCPKCQRPPR